MENHSVRTGNSLVRGCKLECCCFLSNILSQILQTQWDKKNWQRCWMDHHLQHTKKDGRGSWNMYWTRRNSHWRFNRSGEWEGKMIHGCLLRQWLCHRPGQQNVHFMFCTVLVWYTHDCMENQATMKCDTFWQWSRLLCLVTCQSQWRKFALFISYLRRWDSVWNSWFLITTVRVDNIYGGKHASVSTMNQATLACSLTISMSMMDLSKSSLLEQTRTMRICLPETRNLRKDAREGDTITRQERVVLAIVTRNHGCKEISTSNMYVWEVKRNIWTQKRKYSTHSYDAKEAPCQWTRWWFSNGLAKGLGIQEVHVTWRHNHNMNCLFEMKCKTDWWQ